MYWIDLEKLIFIRNIYVLKCNKKLCKSFEKNEVCKHKNKSSGHEPKQNRKANAKCEKIIYIYINSYIIYINCDPSFFFHNGVSLTENCTEYI